MGAALFPALAAGGTAAGAGLGATIIGGALSAFGSVMLSRAEAKEAEKQQLAEEYRAEQSYEGSGEAYDFASGTEVGSSDADDVLKPRLQSQRGQEAKVGSKAAQLNQQPLQTGRVSYDRHARKIVRR